LRQYAGDGAGCSCRWGLRVLGWSSLSLLGEAGAGACHSLSSGGSGWQLSSEKESKIIIKSVCIGINVLRMGMAIIHHWVRLELGVAVVVVRKCWGWGAHCLHCCRQAKLGWRKEKRKKLKDKKAYLLVLACWH